MTAAFWLVFDDMSMLSPVHTGDCRRVADYIASVDRALHVPLLHRLHWLRGSACAAANKTLSTLATTPETATVAELSPNSATTVASVDKSLNITNSPCSLKLRPKSITPVPRNKSVTSPQQLSWRWKTSVVSVVSCRFPNSITTTCCYNLLRTCWPCR